MNWLQERLDRMLGHPETHTRPVGHYVEFDRLGQPKGTKAVMPMKGGLFPVRVVLYERTVKRPRWPRARIERLASVRTLDGQVIWRGEADTLARAVAQATEVTRQPHRPWGIAHVD